LTCANPDDPIVTDAACTVDDDCVVATTLRDCCGSLRITGVNAASLAAFNEDAGDCFLEVCDCLSQPTVDDLGTPDTGQTPFIGCGNGTCTALYPLE
jgi:hypothetical protein